jgi:uncharacterized protein (DUF1800 family)
MPQMIGRTSHPGGRRVRRDGYRLLWIALLVGAVAAPAAAQTVRVVPSSFSIAPGTSRQLTAYVNGVASNRVAWSINGIAGGYTEVGTIDAAGRYTAPAVPPASSPVLARATSLSNPNVGGSSAIAVRYPTPWLSGLSPSRVSLGEFTLQVRGGQFVAGARVLWNGTPLETVFTSSSALTARGTATQAGSVRITVANPGPNSVSGALYLSVSAPTATRTPTRTATNRPTATATREPSRAATATATRAPTRVPTAIPPTATREPTQMPTATSTRVPTMMPTATREPTMMPTSTREPTRTATVMMTVMASPTRTATMMMTGTRSPEPTRTAGQPTATRTATGGTPLPTSPPPTPDPQAVAYGRFLDQASFGPTQAAMARVAQIGIPAYIEEQFSTAESPWPPVTTTDRSEVINAFFGNALNGQDQLRQRVLFALSEVIVESGNKNTNNEDIIPWLQLLSRNAFGNYRTLLREITIDASIGKFLDLANSGFFGGAANENYPREVMQLFSIGLYKLNSDGSVQLDGLGKPIPTYTQQDVQQLARALTGWTYGNPSGIPPTWANSNYYPGPMLPVAAYHDKTAKTVLGHALPANQTATQDLDAVVDILFQHPNVGPFISLRLIRALVTSNPSPAYVARVAAAFDGSGVRGDMKAVIRAVLLDPEARNDTPPATFGRLRTPMQHTIALARALGLNVGPASQFAYLFTDMNESLLDAPSVFGHYSPMYRMPVSGLFGPEFQIYSPSDAVNRANLFYYFFYSPWPINPALQRFVNLAGDPNAMVTAVDQTLLYGRMLPTTRSALLGAMPQMPDNNARAMTAVYLTSMCGEYLVQR